MDHNPKELILENEDFISEDMKLAVKRGAIWMDENYPNWAQAIELTDFDMGNCNQCIIGQAVMDMSYFRVVDIHAPSREGQEEWAVYHGFEASDEEAGESEWDFYNGVYMTPVMRNRYNHLETLWTEEVTKRLG